MATDHNDTNTQPHAPGEDDETTNPQPRKLGDEGIASPGDRLLQAEIEEIMASTPDVPGSSAAPKQPRASLADPTPPTTPQGTSPQSPSGVPPATPPQKEPSVDRTPATPQTNNEQPDKTRPLPQRPAPQPAQNRKEAIRTYYSDVAEAVQGEQISMTDIALAEQKRREHTQTIPDDATKPKQKTNWSPLSITLGVVLLVGGLGVFGYLYLFEEQMGGSPQVPAITHTLVPADDEVFLDTSNIPQGTFENALKEQVSTLEPALGTITALTLTTTALNAAGEEVSRDSTSREFVALLETQIDAALLRSVEERYMVGVHSSGEARAPFIIFETTFFENAFAGMLRWEPAMANDLAFITKPLPQPVIPMPAATSTGTRTLPSATSNEESATATSSPESGKETIAPSQEAFSFRDIIVDNRDARALMNGRGDILLIYSFPNKNTLTITNNTDTLVELFDRLNTVQFRE